MARGVLPAIIFTKSCRLLLCISYHDPGVLTVNVLQRSQLCGTVGYFSNVLTAPRKDCQTSKLADK